MLDYEIYEKCLIGIVKDAILSTNIAEIPDEIDIGILADMIKAHKISGLLYPVLEARGIKNSELYKDFNFWLKTEANQQYYLEKIKESFNAEKIRFVCLKGAYLKTLYPEPYMRSSGDLDIFVDDENTEKVRDIMTGLGFKTERFDHRLQDDVYSLGEFVHIEIHRKLISNKCPWDEKCQEIIGRIVPKKEGSYEYVMSPEDFYLHMIAHMAKHMKYSGCGIRMVLDIWVYLNKFEACLDREILDQRLKYCGLYTFEREVIKLVDYWFNGKAADIKTGVLARYIFDSGIFGKAEQMFATEMAEKTKKNTDKKVGVIKRLIGYTFLPYLNMCMIYPKLSKYPILLPFYWVLRANRILFFEREKIFGTVRSLEGISVSYAKGLAEFKKSIGL